MNNSRLTTSHRLHGFSWYQLLEATRFRLRLHVLLWGTALLLSLGIFSTLAVGFLANFHASSAWALLFACLALVACLSTWGLVHAFRSSTHVKAARHLASRFPSFNLDILGAWELALSPENTHDSPALVRAFWENLETHLQNHGPLAPPGKRLPQKWLLSLGVGLGLCFFLGIYFKSAWETGLQKMRGAETEIASAQSPPLPVHVEVDNPPVVRLLSPESPLSLAPEENSVLLRFEASDDHGLSSLELRYSIDNQTLETLPLALPKTRFVQSEFLWDLAPLALLPGQTVHYSLVARDNDAEAGNKEGLSQTQTLQKFSPAMHQKMALDKTKHAWKQLLAHAADRMESDDISSHAPSKPLALSKELDEQAKHVAAELEQVSKEILQDEQAPKALAAAFENASQTLLRMADNTAKARQKSAQTHNPEFLSKALWAEVSSTEHHLLYLEDLLNQFRFQALSEFGNLLKTQLAELKDLLSQHQHSTNPEEKAALLAQIQKRKASILDLLGRISEMSNADETADDEEVDWSAHFQENTQLSMEFLETALASGHMDEALRQAESMLSQLGDNANTQEARALKNTQANAELMEEFENFRQALESVLTDQEALLKKTQSLHEKQNEKAAAQLAQKTNAARSELNAGLEELRSKLKSLHLERMTMLEQNMREEALKNVEMMKSAVDSNDPFLASDIAKELIQKTDELAAAGKRQETLDRALGNSPEERQRSKKTREDSLEGAEKARDFEERLRSLFGHKSGVATEGDTTSFAEPVSEQEALGKRTRKVQRQMEALSEMAPLFGEEAKERMEQVARHMEKAAARLRLGNAQEGQSEQAQATQGLQTLKQQLQAGGMAKASVPLPSASGSLGQGLAQSPKRLHIPKGTAAAKPFLRKELLETMRQGVPEGYAEPVRRYYEELVK